MINSSAAAATVIVLDCCHSGAFKGTDVGRPFAGDGRYILSSCRSSQLAPDAKHSTETSRFTGHLIRGLLGEAAIGRDAESVTLVDLYQYMYRCMRAEDGPIPQHSFSGRGDIPIARLASGEQSSRLAAAGKGNVGKGVPANAESGEEAHASSEPDDFVLLVDTLRQRQLVRMEDLPLTIEGRYTGRIHPVRVILQDSQGNNYLQNPEVRFLPDGTWFASNILPGEGIELINFVAVGTTGRSHFERMVEHRAFGAFSKLPSDALVLVSVRITRVS